MTLRQPTSTATSRNGLRFNRNELVMITVLGQIASPLSPATPYRIGQDGVPRVLPGPGGIVLSHRVGDRCVGLAADHVEPGVSIRNEQHSIKGERGGANLALQTFACIGNQARIVSGMAAGSIGTVTGKHGGIDTVLLDFPMPVMRRLAIGDRIQVYAHGQGMRLTDHPEIAAFNLAPRLLDRWPSRTSNERLSVGVTHVIPSSIMGSGLGRNEVFRGDYDIQMFDPEIVRRHRLGSLRFGDIVAIRDADHRFGRAYRQDAIVIGCVVHSDSTTAGHGPGVTTLLTGPVASFDIHRDASANIAAFLGIRRPSPPVERQPLVLRDQTRLRDQPRKTVARANRNPTANRGMASHV